MRLEDLWGSAPSADRSFDPAQISALPPAARRYLEHAILPGTPLGAAVRLRMHGEIKLKSWHPFSAEEVIVWGRGMIWQARARSRGLPVRGSDSLVDGHAAMRWKLFGLLPLVNASGDDITRSAAGRANLESLWLPSALSRSEVSWTAVDELHLRARFTAHGEPAEIDYILNAEGGLQAVSMSRWGNPGGAPFGYATCGGFVEEEGRFGGYTIPTRLRVGWHFGTPRFETEGEFFHVTIDHAAYK
jgi:hypothetical protein